MSAISDLQDKIALLKAETAKGAITADRLGIILDDTVAILNGAWLLANYAYGLAAIEPVGKALTGSYDLVEGDRYLCINGGESNRTLNLVSAALTPGITFTVVNCGSTNNLSFHAGSAYPINGMVDHDYDILPRTSATIMLMRDSFGQPGWWVIK